MSFAREDKALSKTILVLGASYSQIPLFQAAKRLGVRSIAATIPGPYAGIPYADEVVYCDITKPEEVLQAVKDLSIDAVTTCCMDVGTRTMGYLCKMLSLPGPGIGAEAACDKSLQKQLYEEAGIRTAPYFLIRSVEDLQRAGRKIGYPLMLKAVDLMGSRGVFRADSEEEALSWYPLVMEQTRKDYCIAEKFLAGTMFGVEAMMSRGSLAYVLPLGNDLHAGNPPFPQGHHVPWERADALYEKICDVTQRVCKALAYDNCALDMDCMLQDGEIWMIESTPRAGATAITDMVGLYYGIDYFEAIVRSALGEDVSDLFRAKSGLANASWLIGADRTGILEEIVLPEHLSENVVDLSFNVKSGDEVRKFSSGRDRIGQMIVKGNSAGDCLEEIRTILQNTEIKVREYAGIGGNTLL